MTNKLLDVKFNNNKFKGVGSMIKIEVLFNIYKLYLLNFNHAQNSVITLFFFKLGGMFYDYSRKIS